MAILENRVKTKNHLVELAKLVFLSLKNSILYVVIVFCCFLLYFSSPGVIANISLEVSGSVLSTGTLVYNGVAEKVTGIYNKISNFTKSESENVKLKIELEELRQLYQNLVLLKQENEELRKILNVTANIQNKYVTAKIVGLTFTPFSNTAIIQAGSSSNINLNDVVQVKDGIIGRIVSLSNHYSTVMLVSDPNSRIPVITAESKERGILAKQGDSLKLIYLREGHSVKVGELIYTSGDGKIYPYGLLIARIEKINDQGIFVKTTANLNDTDFVIVESKIRQDL